MVSVGEEFWFWLALWPVSIPFRIRTEGSEAGGGIALRLAHLLVPGLRQLGSSDASVSLCDLSMWILQHGGIKGPRLVMWPPGAPKEHGSREKGPEESCETFYNQSWKSHRITCTWSQACPDSRGEFTGITLGGGMSAPHWRSPVGWEVCVSVAMFGK